jgi:hypothetical protein
MAINGDRRALRGLGVTCLVCVGLVVGLRKGFSGPPPAHSVPTGHSETEGRRDGRPPLPRPSHVRPDPRPSGLSLVEHVGAALDGMGDMALTAPVGYGDVLPLPKGEPGGRVVGRGKDIRGVFRLVRVKHDLSDWWADADSLNRLAGWLNRATPIKTDMAVEGGAVRLTDAALMKSPMLWMTGHDPSVAASQGLIREGGGGQKFANDLSGLEIAALRKYLVDRQGLLVFDDCGVNAPSQAMVKIVLGQLRRAMPEYGVGRVPNDHLLYRSYYDLGGPPIGFDIFWWGTRPPQRNYLEGISVRGKLVALMVRRDYLCAMRTVGLAGEGVNYSPGVMRWATNAVVYSLTTGGIADYRHYRPADDARPEAARQTAPAAARIATTPIDLRR